MGRKRKDESSLEPIQASRPALSIEARENQVIALAIDRVEQRIRNGEATSQELVHFLKLGSTKERQERKIREKQIELLEAKTEEIKSSARVEELYQEAMNAMRKYSGSIVRPEDVDK